MDGSLSLDEDAEDELPAARIASQVGPLQRAVQRCPAAAWGHRHCQPPPVPPMLQKTTCLPPRWPARSPVAACGSAALRGASWTARALLGLSGDEPGHDGSSMGPSCSSCSSCYFLGP